MNFSPQVRAWLLLVSLLFGSSLTLGYTAFLSGASVAGAIIVGAGNGLLGLYHALSESPKDKLP
jgi:hypothetical protein